MERHSFITTTNTTETDEEFRNLALAVVDRDEEATLLCLRDAESRWDAIRSTYQCREGGYRLTD